jgi:phage protein U
MFAQLGSTVFEGLFSFHEYEDEGETKYAEVDLIGGKSDLQLTGQALDTVTLGIRLHESFCNPQLRYSELKTYRLNGEILPFIDGYGNVIGNYVIQRMKRTVNNADAFGRVLLCECELTLKEYVDPNRALTRVNNARSNAIALGATSVSFKASGQTAFPAADVFSSVKGIAAGASTAGDNINKAATDTASAGSYLRHAQDGVSSVVQSAQDLQNKADKYVSQGVAITTDFTNANSAVKSTAQNLSAAIASGNVAAASANFTQLNLAVGQLNKAALPVQKQLIFR